MKSLIKKILSEIQVPHHYQPTGNSCGPTCLKMVHDFFVGNRFKISDICRACGTDWVVGTPPDRMVKGLQYMGIKYIEHMGEEDPYQSLKDSIDKGHPCVVRANVQGTPHWIIVVDYDHDTLMVNDPWLGRLLYEIDEFDEIWFSGRDKIREYFYYEITNADADVYPDDDIEDEEFPEDEREDFMSEETETAEKEWWEDWTDEDISYFIHELQSVHGVTANVAEVQEFSNEVDVTDLSIEQFAEEFVSWLKDGDDYVSNGEEGEVEGDPNQLEIEFPEDKKTYSEGIEVSNFEDEEEILDALRVGMKVFEGQMTPKALIEYLSKAADWDISVKATHQGKIVGFYLLAENQIADYMLHYMQRDYNCYSPEECEEKNPGSIKVNPMEFQNLDGVEGVALGIDPEYKGLGIGKKLIEYSQSLPYDYIWGQQYEHLGNIEHWTKRREIAAYFPGLYLTYQML
jgi:GNAT superfamily N-acetyltransferase